MIKIQNDQNCFRKLDLENIFKRILNIKNLFILIIFLIFFIISITNYLNLKSISHIGKLLSLSNNSYFKPNNIYSNISNEYCDFINKNHKQYQVVIDGEIYPKSLPTYLNHSINFDCLNKIKKFKKILFWNDFFHYKEFMYGVGKQSAFIKNNCPVTTCETTNDKSQLNQSDLVLVHINSVSQSIPSNRSSNQRWVFVNYEPPFHTQNLNSFNGLFNLTSTYRIDSDFHYFYETDSKFMWKLNTSFNDSFDYYEGRSEFAAAIISNCGARSKRLDYIKEIQKYIQVRVFGGCSVPCPKVFKNSNKTADCKEIISKEFKFYFAFENSFCKDYITEKFFQTLTYDIIPVVMGGGNYEHYIPKSGFINVKDYSSPKELADYLLYLDRNRTAYNSYFKWKKYISYLNAVTNFSPICHMCIKLHLESIEGFKTQVIHDLQTYWHSNTCKIPSSNSKNLILN